MSVSFHNLNVDTLNRYSRTSCFAPSHHPARLLQRYPPPLFRNTSQNHRHRHQIHDQHQSNDEELNLRLVVTGRCEQQRVSIAIDACLMLIGKWTLTMGDSIDHTLCLLWYNRYRTWDRAFIPTRAGVTHSDFGYVKEYRIWESLRTGLLSGLGWEVEESASKGMGCDTACCDSRSYNECGELRRATWNENCMRPWSDGKVWKNGFEEERWRILWTMLVPFLQLWNKSMVPKASLTYTHQGFIRWYFKTLKLSLYGRRCMLFLAWLAR